MNDVVEITPLEINANGSIITQALVEKAMELAGLGESDWPNIMVYVAADVWSDLCYIYGDAYHADRIRRPDLLKPGELHILRPGATPQAQSTLLARIFNLAPRPAAAKWRD